MRFVDLSHPMRSAVVPLSVKPHPCRPVTLIEAPALLIRNGKTIDRLHVSSFFRVAVLLDLRHKEGMEIIEDEDLEAAEEAAGLAVRGGEIIVLRTGWEEYSSSKGYCVGFPSLSRNAVEYLLFRGISGVGVDCPSVDLDRRLMIHRRLFRGGALVIENLCNLEELDRSRFQLVALPLRVSVGRSVARVIGVVAEDSG